MKHLLTFTLGTLFAIATSAQTYIEPLTRGVVALPMQKGNFISWRYLSTDSKDVTFDVLRDGQTIAKGLSSVTNFADSLGTSESVYTVVASNQGNSPLGNNGTTAHVWSQPYLSLPLDRPADGTLKNGRPYSYAPNDCSCADLDGDGEYEIVLKWDPSASRDNSHAGYTGEVIIDAYKVDYAQVASHNSDNAMHRLWRINLGKNIRAGAHYTQFLVYDFDGDGKAELICKTAPGSVDGKGNYVNQASTDKLILKADNTAEYANKNGHILAGPEYLTVFSGQDGHAINTIFYTPNRAFGVAGSAEKPSLAGKDAAEYDTEGWGDNSPGNRGERYLACVAFLGGKSQNPSAVMCRGYYTRANLWAVDFDGKKLSTRWLHVSKKHDWKVTDINGNTIKEASDLDKTAFGQGAHSLAVGDVDDDGCDEITYGGAAIDHDGSLLYSTGLGHGDAQHLGDLDPDRPGLEFYMPHEAQPCGSDLRDARTGEILFHETDTKDTGRGIAADIDPNHRGSEFWCAAQKAVHAINGEVIAETQNWTPQNFRIYWDGDLQDELIGNGSPRFPPGSDQRTMQRGRRPDRNAKQGQEQDKRREMRGERRNMRQGEQPQGQGMPPQMGKDGQPQEGGFPPQMDQNGGPQGQGMMPQMDRSMRQPSSYYIAKWNGEGCDHVLLNGKDLSDYGSSSSCNGTKATPCLQADLFGDWREELVLFDSSDNAHLNIFTTNIPSPYRVPTLMHDHVYRMGVVWQNVAYNQPPHLGYYLGDFGK